MWEASPARNVLSAPPYGRFSRRGRERGSLFRRGGARMATSHFDLYDFPKGTICLRRKTLTFHRGPLGPRGRHVGFMPRVIKPGRVIASPPP